MARFLDNASDINRSVQKKKKKKEETVKKVQSPSVSKNNQRTTQAQEQKMYGGMRQKPQTVKRSTTSNNKTNTQQRQQTTSQQTQRTVDRLNAKYGQNRVVRNQSAVTSSSRRQRNANDNLDLKQTMLRTSQEQRAERREERRQASNERRLAAQNQKMTAGVTKEQQEVSRRALKNTPGLVKKAVQDTVSSHGQTIADLTEMTASNKNGTMAKAMKMGLNPEKDKKQMAELESERKKTVEKARLDREKWAAEQDQRQAEWDKKVNGATGLEKAYYGAVESGTGMVTDLALGMGTQGGSLAAMFSRTYGSTRGQAQKEGATESEDRTYALLQAAKEVGTELMFPGVGLAKGYAKKTGLPLAERVANNLTKRMASKTAADLTGAGVRLLGGTVEENLEEVAGFGLDPLIKEFSYGRNVRTRQKMADLQNESDQLRANIKSEDDARRVASYLSSSEWLDQNKQQYMDAGLNEKQAQEVAEKMRDYMTASLTGDTETMDVLEKDIASTLSKGEFSYRKSLDKSELMDTLASTTLLTMTTGLPGTATTTMRGSVIRDNLGTDGIRTLAESAMNYEDKEASKRGEVARDSINAGKELTASQVYELAVSQAQQVEKDTQRVVAKNNVVADTLESEKLVAPMIMRDAKGNIHGDAIITSRYNESEQEAENVLRDLDKDQKLSLSDAELAVGSRAIAGFQTGAFTINDANALNYTNTAVRDAFEKVTGVDLGQYVVRDKNGAVDYAETNAATKDALFTMAADNFIETARAETENFKDVTKGITAEQMAARVGSEGDKAISIALDTVDPADGDTYGLMASAAQNVYEYGRYTEDSWDDVSGRLSEMYPGLSHEALQEVYDAAKRDKTIAETPYYNARITAGESTSKMDMSEAEQAEYGKFTNDSGNDIGIKERNVLTSLASEFNINIRLMPSETFEYKYTDKNGKEKTAYKNGWYDPKTGTMLLNGGNDMQRNLVAVALHEITHHIALYAPDEYLALSNRVMETYYKNDADAFNAAIQRRQESYKTQVGQNLSEEQALEEIIADAIGEMSTDPDFISQICTEEPTLADQIIKAIKSVLRKLRAILASGDVAEEHEDAFFESLDMWDEAQRLWMNAAKVAQQQRANQAIDDWDAHARETATEDTQTRLSIPEYTQEEMDQHRQALIDEMTEYYDSPYTDNYDEAGFVFPDGRMLRMGMNGQRGEDHRIASHAYDDLSDREDALNSFINEGNIRWMPELMTIEFGPGTEPTQEQYDWVRKVAAEKGIREIDYTDAEGNYLGGGLVRTTNPESIVNGIKRFYGTGETESVSQVAQFRYSIDAEKAEEISHDIGPDVRFSIPTFRYDKAKGKFIASLNGGKGGFAGLSEIVSGRTILQRIMKKNGFDQKQTDAVVGFLEHMADYLEDEELQMKYHFIGWDDLSNGEVTVRRDGDGNIVSVAVSAMVVNGEYPVNFDLTTICNKREGVMEVIQALTQKYDADTGKTVLNSIKLTDEKMWSINKALKAEGIDTACLGCFVEARRYYTNRFIDKIDDVWNSAVREARRKLGLPEEEYFNFAKGRKIKGEDYNQVADLWTAYDESTESKRSPAQRIKILMDEIVKNKEVDSPYLKLISAEDILTPEGIRGFKELSTHNKDRDMVKMIKSIYGTSAPKEILAFTPYNSEIALLPDKIKGIETSEYLKSIGGTRVQSFSDFKMEHFFDHMQMVAEEAARGFVNHGYSKVIAYPRLFGLTGRKINMSVMFDVLPVSEWQKVLGCSEAAAVDIAQKYQGLRFVKEKPADNPDNRPYKEVTIEGVHGYLTYLVSDADYVNSVYDRLYQENLDAGMDPEAARRKANTDKPFEQSINYKDAVELENREGYKENVGIIAVAFGDEHLRMLLDDPNVRYIIPYHRSGLPVFIAQKTALDIARNYTDYQNTNKAKRGLWTSPEGQSERMKSKYAKFVEDNPDLEYPAITFFDKEINGKGYTVEFGKKNSKEKISLAGTGTFDVYENLETVKDIREISNAYLEHCIENNQVPVFHEFAGHPNYYKMLFDFAVTDGTTDHIYPQRPVKNIYPGLNLEEIVNSGRTIDDLTPEDFSEFYEEIERGLADQNAKTELRRQRLGNVLDDDLLSQTGENSIVADSNIQHIVNGTPDYTSVRYANEDVSPEVTGADIRNSIAELYDDAYMSAVNSGNMEEAQKYVDEAAKRAGYNQEVFHGTGEYFNVFNLGREGIHLGNIDQASQVAKQRYDIRSKNTLYTLSEIADSIDKLDDETLSSVLAKADGRIRMNTNQQIPAYSGDMSDKAQIAEHLKQINQAYEKDRGAEPNLSLPTFDRKVGENLMRLYARINNPFVIENDLQYWSAPYIASVLLKRAEGETTLDALYEIDGSRYMDISGSDISLDDMARMDLQRISGGLVKGDRAWELLNEVLYWNGGYDGIKYLNKYEGDKNSYSYLATNRSAVKSADTVTYAEDGSVIPLSERFDPGNNDIRYSLPTQDSDGNVLTDGQMEYFANSQARDDQGKLLVLYHSSPEVFYEFDPDMRGENTGYDNTAYGFFVTDDPKFSSRFGENQMKLYANIEKLMISPFGAGLKYSDEECERITREWLNVIDPDQFEYYEEAKEDDPELSLYDWYNDLWGLGEDPNEYAEDYREWLEDAGYDAIELFEGTEEQLHTDGTGTERPVTTYAVFNSNQLKDIRNTDPTNVPDIRFSLPDEDTALDNVARYADTTDRIPSRDAVIDEGRMRMSISEDDFIAKTSSTWNEADLTHGMVLAEDSVRRNIMKMMSYVMKDSGTGKKYRSTTLDETIKSATIMFHLAKAGKVEKASEYAWNAARRIVDDIDYNDTLYTKYKDMREYLRKTKIAVPEGLKYNESFVEFARDNRDRLLLKDKGRTVGSVYKSLRKKWPEMFAEDITDPIDQLLQIDYVLDYIQPYREAYTSEAYAELVDEVATSLCDIVSQGEAYHSVADVLTEKYEAKVKAMKQRHQEAQRKLRETEKEKRNRMRQRAENWKQTYRERQKEKISELNAKHKRELRAQKLKAQFEISALKTNREYNIKRLQAEKERAVKEEKQKGKEQRKADRMRGLHKEIFSSINGSYNELVKRLKTNTKDKHIPEQYKKELATLLAAFDLQTVGSKKREIKNGPNGYVRKDISKAGIKMLELQTMLNNIAARAEQFHINDSVTDIIDELLGKNANGETDQWRSVEGKTIDDLDLDQLKNIDKLLKALIHEFNTYESVRIGTKRQQAADIGTAQIDSALKHAELFGPGKDYNNVLGAADKIINMDEMTPAYLFKRIDPNKTGLGMLFRELRKSFDKYVRNQKQLNEWMEEILKPYHKGGKLWNKYGADEIENWRRAKATNTFKLQSGDEIRLTPAQMMSVYCLARRPQAYQHMVGAGIVVKPVTFQAKLETDLKRKTNWALPTILTDEDIKMISTALTPDQKKVADQLQKLMATKMADWGNEASMSVIGIKLFEDPDYFPIQSDRAALEEDFTADQFVDMIRNFGFTKAVQPGARNAIAIDDIFTVVSTHCNNMNLYNAYSESMNDFMKVYNYHALREDGSDYSVKQAVAHAYSQKATTFISSFMRDLNGNVSKGRVTGIDAMMNAALGNAKKASVFANGRVALQQPTAIMRAFAVISPKYLKGIKIERGAMKEMFEHCPIALWKSWGYYDINMGKSIEDIMMNNGNWLEDTMTDIYGKADNVTWTAIWQMCKAEVKDKNPKVEEGSEEFWNLVNERMTEVVDLTQVVDSPFHRSHAMRDKQVLVKMATSFMAEPTLTFNMVRDGLVNSFEMYKTGDKAGAAKLLSRTSSVFVSSAFATAAAAAIWDVLRSLGGDDDDDEPSAFAVWWTKCLENFQDNLKLWNNIYYIKDISSLFDGWGTSNLALQGWKQLADGYAQLTGAYRVTSKKAWWENALSGIGYLTGTPYGTILKDGKAIFKLFGFTTPAALQEQLDRINSLGTSSKDMNRGDSSASGVGSSANSNDSKSTSSARLWTYDNAPFQVEDGSVVDNFLNHFGVNLTAAEIKSVEAKQAAEEHDRQVKKITNSLSEYSGEEYDKHLWDRSELEGYGKALESGDFERAEEIEKLFLDCGGSQEFIDGKKFYHYKKNYVKSIVYDPTDEQIEQQTQMKDFLLSHGMTETELSEKVYKSQTTKELKVAFRLNDEDAIIDELVPLIRAGLSYDDFVKAYENRNRVDIKKYKESDGKYADRLKSTGTYQWPINGQITSNFGHRSSPGGIGSTNHQGLDIAGNMGDPVSAADGGTVVFAGWYGGAGKTIMIEHDDGTVTQYSHLSWWDAKVGDTVAQGQYIGKVGSTGNSTGPHLHFGVKVNGSYVDPLTKLN